MYELLRAGFEGVAGRCASGQARARRKSDVADRQWLQSSMSHGLLRAAFRPAAEGVCCARWRVI